MARRKDDRDRAAAPAGRDASAPTDEPAAAGPRAFVVEEERLSDGRYILYYGWAAEPAAPPAPRKARRSRSTGR